MKPRELNGYAVYDPKLGLMSHFGVSIDHLAEVYDLYNEKGSFNKAVRSGEIKVVHAKMTVVGGV